MQHAVISKTEATPITATPEPTWATVAATARGLWNAFGRADTGQYPWHPIMKDLAKQAGGLARTKVVSVEKAVQAATTAENLARVLAEDPSGYRNYAINPDGLAELVCGVTSIQSATRHLASIACPGAGGIGIERAFYPAGERKAQPAKGSPWHEARAAYYAAKAASDIYNAPEMDTVDPAMSERVLDAVAEAMERWETMAPPTLAAMTEVMLASLDFNGWGWKFQKTTEPDAWRDLLDGGDPHQIFAARYTLHALRLASVDHPARSVVPTSGYRAPFDEMTPDCGPETEAAWREHHDHARSVFCGPAAVYGAEYLLAAE